MKKIYLLSFIVLSISVTSCTRFIGPPMAGASNIGYLPRPFITDSAKSKTYISGEFSASSAVDDHTEINSGILTISRAYANKNFNASIGAFGFLGGANYTDNYNDGTSSSNIIINDFHKLFGGWGLRSTIGLQSVSENKHTNFRIISWENAYSQEYGQYAQFRGVLSKQDLTNSNNEYVYISKFTKIFTTGFSSEVIWNEAFDNNDFTMGIRGFLGFSPRLGNSFYTSSSYDTYDDGIKSLVFTGSLFLSYKKVFGTLQLGSGDKIYGGKIGIGYTL